jgi:hypothetical protein
MTPTSLHELVPILQVAIGPVILISGISLFLLNLTNRFGRIIDRSRVLSREVKDSSSNQQLADQVKILYRRARLMRLSVSAATAGLLLAALLVIALFLTALLKIEAAVPVGLIFICAMLSFIVSLAAFMKDIQLSLAALSLELGSNAPASEKSPFGADARQMKSIRLFNV